MKYMYMIYDLIRLHAISDTLNLLFECQTFIYDIVLCYLRGCKLLKSFFSLSMVVFRVRYLFCGIFMLPGKYNIHMSQISSFYNGLKRNFVLITLSYFKSRCYEIKSRCLFFYISILSLKWKAYLMLYFHII